MKTARWTGKRRCANRASAGGFTLIELMFATAISTFIAFAAMSSLIEGSHQFQSASSEIMAREKGSYALQRISNDIQNAMAVTIYPSYTSATSGTTGSCVVITATTGNNGAYYLYAPSNDINTGSLYYCKNTALGINPAADAVLSSYVQDVEFQNDANGCVRTGMKIAIYDYYDYFTGGFIPPGTSGTGSYTSNYEANLVRLVRSDLPRNNP
jgi:type II secretory pathway pseudopilin PulG